MEPNPGEYWFAFCDNRRNFTIVKIINEVPDVKGFFTIKRKGLFGRYEPIERADLYTKWTPNLFWKLMGYK